MEVSLHSELREQGPEGVNADSQIRPYAAVLVSDCLGDRGSVAPSCTNIARCYEMGLRLLVGSRRA